MKSFGPKLAILGRFYFESDGITNQRQMYKIHLSIIWIIHQLCQPQQKRIWTIFTNTWGKSGYLL